MATFHFELTELPAEAEALRGEVREFLREHSLHFATRRLWSWRAEFGSESHRAGALGRRLVARGAGPLWPDLTAR